MKKFALILLTAFMLSACEGLPPKPDGTVTRDLVGGSVLGFRKNIENHNGIVRLSEEYFSAATLWLAHPAACVTPDAEFITHQPFNGITSLPLSPKNHREMVNFMAEHYPEPLKSRFLAEFGHGPELFASHKRVRATGAEFIAAGTMNDCDDHYLAVVN